MRVLGSVSVVGSVGGLLVVLLGACDGPSTDSEAATPDGRVGDLALAVEGLEQGVRVAVEGFHATIEDVDDLYARADSDAVAAWTGTKEEIGTYHKEIEVQLHQLRDATAEEARTLRVGLATNVEMIARRVERARLEAVEDPHEFVALAQARLAEIERDVEALDREVHDASPQVKEEASLELERIQGRTLELKGHLEGLGEADVAEIEAFRGEVVEALAELSGRVRKRLIEIQHDLSDL